eukprot:GILK01014719.1.p1 GENE.GILK01014719.1~~GILK01014719.1.p1  ORF type:complete len:834 (-),score=38.56 GILK01014719.1:101-2488(-)
MQDGRLDDESFRLFTKGGASLETEEIAKAHPKPFPWVQMHTWKNVVVLSQLPKFKFVCEVFIRNESYFKAFIEHEAPESIGTIPGYDNLTSFEWLFAVRALREDRALVAAVKYISDTVGPHLAEVPAYNLTDITDDVSGQRTPIVFLLSSGSDPTTLIEAEAKKLRRNLIQLSLGQGQEATAMAALEVAKDRGDWVAFQNCHLGIPFLEKLQEWILEPATADHPDFRMFLTCDPTPEFPTTLLLRCLKLTNEPPEGMAPTMKKLAHWVSADSYDMYRRPEWKPLIYCLCFVHSILLERRKYGARGWTGSYQFSEGDFQASLTYLQNHFAAIGDDARRGNPVQWDGVRYMIGDIHYGGRVTLTSDRATLRATMAAFLKPENLKIGAYLCPELKKFPIRELSDINSFRAAVEEDFLSEEPPQIVGLYANAETQHRTRDTAIVLQTMLSIQPRTVTATGTSTRESAVLDIVVSSLKRIPPTFPHQYLKDAALRLDKGATPKPLTVFFILEAGRLNELIEKVFSTLRDLRLALSGAMGMSTALNEVANALFASQVPEVFYSYSRSATTYGAWFNHLLKRHDQIQTHLRDGFCLCYNISALFNPQGFINSIRQDVCRKHASDNWALDRVEPRFHVTKMTSPADVEKVPEEGVYLHGLLLDGASWDVARQRLKAPLPKDTLKEMPVIHVSAQLAIAPSGGNAATSGNNNDDGMDEVQRKKEVTQQIMAQLLAGNTNISASMFRKMRAQRDSEASVTKVRFPLFVLPQRGDSNYVCDVDLSHDEKDASVWQLRGVALLCQSE